METIDINFSFDRINYMVQTTSHFQQINSQVKDLKHEIRLLRSFFISMIGEDKEGNYNPKFIKEMLKAAKEVPTHPFQNAKFFLKNLRGK